MPTSAQQTSGGNTQNVTNTKLVPYTLTPISSIPYYMLQN